MHQIRGNTLFLAKSYHPAACGFGGVPRPAAVEVMALEHIRSTRELALILVWSMEIHSSFNWIVSNLFTVELLRG